MSGLSLRERFEQELAQLPVVDVHSHLDPDRMTPSSPADLLFYHMLTYPLAAGGAPAAALRPEEVPEADRPGWEERLGVWFRHAADAQPTVFFSLLSGILNGLYGFAEELTPETYPRFAERFARANAEEGRARRVLDDAGVVRVLSSMWRTSRPAVAADGLVLPTFERCPVPTGIVESVGWSERLRSVEERTGRRLRSSEDLEAFLDGWFSGYDWSSVRAFVCWVSSMADFTPVPAEEVDRLWREAAEGVEPDRTGAALLDAALVRSLCRTVRGRVPVFQLVYGVQYLRPGRLSPQPRAAAGYASGLGWLVREFPDLHFNILSGFEAHEPELCGLVLAYPNVSLAGFWWFAFHPDAIRSGLRRRLSTLPLSRQMAFFSDGYCVDWIWARLRLVRACLAEVLAEKVEKDGWSLERSLRAAKAVLEGTPRMVFGL